ncbi:MAG: regulatory protein RecX [Acinetobacter tandoii]|uniref:regulatory protein RecX n=1 Tax=Acinetobacter tandoii TaxID=202954 RepID=UPI003D6C584D
MSQSKFPKLLDYQSLKQEFGTSEPEQSSLPDTTDHSDASIEAVSSQNIGLTGSRLRSYAFAVLTRKEFSKAELIEKLAAYAASREEVINLVNELSEQNYQSDQRVADIVLSSQKRKGKGPQRIKLALKNKKINSELIQEELKAIDWVEQAYQLKIKKFGNTVEKDPKLKAKQIRFLQYRGFDMDVIMKAINKKEDEE